MKWEDMVAQPSLSLKAADAPPDLQVGDGELLLLDAAPDASKKIKKAFCEPQNVAHCPPLVLTREVVLAFSDGRALTIGETKHDAMGPLEEAFGSGALHPADLKPAVNKALEAVLDKVRKGVAADAELAKAQKEMEKVHKRMTAKK